MTREEAIKWIDDRMCFGRGTFTEHHPPNIDECWQAGMMAIEALSTEPKAVECSGCKCLGSYESDFPCVNCVRITKDYYCGTGMRGGDDE